MIRKFLFVAVDYFTKWAEAEATNTISEQNVLNFVFRNIICRFGVPIQIITDNGTQFTGKKLREFCEDSGIKLSFAPVYHPQANGQVEVTNRTITSILKRKVGTASEGYKYLPWSN